VELNDPEVVNCLSSHPQSDPFVEIAKAQEGGAFTVVYRSPPIKKTLNPRCVMSSDELL